MVGDPPDMSVKCALRLAASTVTVVLAVSACTRGADPDTATPAPAHAVLNGLSANDVLAAIDAAGMPTPHAHDVTADKCPKLHCVSAIDSDTISILKFDGSGHAQAYDGALSNDYQVEDVVVVFAATVTAAQRAAYERTVERAVA